MSFFFLRLILSSNYFSTLELSFKNSTPPFKQVSCVFLIHSMHKSTKHTGCDEQGKKKDWIGLPVDHPSIYWRTLKSFAVFAVNLVLYHGIVGMYPMYFGMCDIRLSVIHRLVTAANDNGKKEEEKKRIKFIVPQFVFIAKCAKEIICINV